VAVARRVRVVAGVAAGEQAVPGPGLLAGGEVLVGGEAREAEDAVRDRHVEVGALAGGAAPYQRGQDRHHRVHPATGAVGDGEPGDRRLPAGGPPTAVEEAADAQVVEVVGRPLRAGTGLPEAAGRAVDEAGVTRRRRLPTDAE